MDINLITIKVYMFQNMIIFSTSKTCNNEHFKCIKFLGKFFLLEIYKLIHDVNSMQHANIT